MTAVREVRARVSERLGRAMSDQEWGFALFLAAHRKIREGLISEDDVYEVASKSLMLLKQQQRSYATETP